MAVDETLSFPALTEAVMRVHGSIPAAVVSVLEEFSFAVLDYIRANWPVDTGRSLRAWQVGPADGVVGLRFVNDAADQYGEYAEYVHFSGAPSEPAQAEILIEQIRAVLEAPLTEAIQAMLPIPIRVGV